MVQTVSRSDSDPPPYPFVSSDVPCKTVPSVDNTQCRPTTEGTEQVDRIELPSKQPKVSSGVLFFASISILYSALRLTENSFVLKRLPCESETGISTEDQVRVLNHAVQHASVTKLTAIIANPIQPVRLSRIIDPLYFGAGQGTFGNGVTVQGFPLALAFPAKSSPRLPGQS